MNKKIFTYTLLIFIALFGFNMNVRAVGVCVYNIHNSDKAYLELEKIALYDTGYGVKVMVTQDAKDKTEDLNTGTNGGNWKYLSDFISTNSIAVDNDYSYECIYDGKDCNSISSLDVCPATVKTEYVKTENSDGWFGTKFLGSSFWTLKVNFSTEGENGDDVHQVIIDNAHNGIATTEIKDFYCVYDDGNMFQQKKSGTTAEITFYHNSTKNVSINYMGWLKKDVYYINGDETTSWKGDYFTSCPNKYKGNGRFADSGSGASLIESGEGIAELNDDGYTSTYVEYTTDATSCDEINFENVWLSAPDTSKYDVNSCLYCYEYKVLFGDHQIWLVQLDFSSSSFEVKHNFGGLLNAGFDVKTLNQTFVGICPPQLFVRTDANVSNLRDLRLDSTKNDFTFDKVRSLNKDTNIPLILEPIEITSCEALLPEEAREFLRFLVKALQIGIPLVLIALGIVDFARGIFSGEDEMKKIQQKFIKRIILAVAFYLIPNVIELLLSIASGVWPSIDPGLCGIFEKKS